MDKLLLKKSDYEKIIQYCYQEKPEEACGILAGNKLEKSAKVQKVYLMENTESSAEEYLMNPEEQFKVFRDMRDENLELISIFHSHPHTPAIPSEHDIKMANYPEAIYTIISLAEDEPNLRAYRIRNNDYKEIEVDLI